MLRLFYRKYVFFSAFHTDATLKTLHDTKKFETIYALCSGQGKCGVAVIRVSGHEAPTVLKLMTSDVLPKPRLASLRMIRHVSTNEALDKGLVLWFPGPNSFTGEPVCEFQVHGGPAIVSGILESLGRINNCRLAKPGEFTKRAFYNKKMDLVEAEGLADLINAETELQRRQAFMQSQGTLSKLYKKWKDDIYDSLSNLEALFNFEIEENEDDDKAVREIRQNVSLTYQEICGHLLDGRRGERLRSGVQVAIIGEPNVGKSSIYNLLCRRKASIVTPHPGTTRDTLEACLDIRGYPVILYDTCGIRYDEINPIEAEGVKVTLNTVNVSELLILVADIKKYMQWKAKNNKPIAHFIINYLKDLELSELVNPETFLLKNLVNKQCIVVLNKCDTITQSLDRNDLDNAVVLSINTDHGVEDLLNELAKYLQDLCARPSRENPTITKIRHRNLMETTQKHLQSFLCDTESTSNLDYALLSNHLRYALKPLVEVVEGKPDNAPVTDVLDEIFHNFCVGK